uniref:PCI domain-containing protein n=1 Tax=Macrostomum lignano TaxID=282301 RepID=A0A1I8G9E1_9PLAT
SALMKEASRLPDCASTVRCCLKALICLKYGRTDEARSILSSFKATDSRFVRHEDLDSVSDVDAFVLNKLDTCDWAKKFCFVFSGRPQLEFLPKEINRHFPICILYVNVFSINFQALYRCLCLHLHVANESQAKSWFKEILEQDEAQLQEILVMLQFCKDREMLVSLIHKHRKAIYEQKHTFDMALNSMLADQQLMGLSTTRSLEETVHRLQQRNEEVERFALSTIEGRSTLKKRSGAPGAGAPGAKALVLVLKPLVLKPLV